MNRFSIVLLGVLLAACQVPQSSNHRDAQVRFQAAGFSGERTLFPTLPGGVTFDVQFAGTSGEGVFDFSGQSAGSTLAVPTGTFLVSAAARDGGGNIIGEAQPKSVTLLPPPTVNTVTLDLLPVLDGLGTVAITYNWPVDAADTVEVRMVDYPSLDVIDTSSLVSEDTGTVTVAGSLPSGTYLLSVRLSRIGDISNAPAYQPTITDVVRVYQGLETAYTYNLSTELNKAPAAPTSVSGTFSPDNDEVTVEWISPPGIQDGFVIIRDGVEVGTQTDPAARSWSETLSPSNTSYAYEVKAINNWGESAATAGTVNVPQLPYITNAASGLHVVSTALTMVTNASMTLAWTDTGGNVNLLRSDSLEGPYVNVYFGSGAGYTDSTVTPDKQYFYALVDGAGGEVNRGWLLNLPETVIAGTPYQFAPTGIVPAATMVWEGTTNQAIGRIGRSYVYPDPAKLQYASDGNPWQDSELIDKAILAGGYAWVAFGQNTDDTPNGAIAAFDTATGNVLDYRPLDVYHLTNLVQNKDRYDLYGENTNGTGATISNGYWSSLVNPSSEVTIDFQVPTEPVILGGGGGLISFGKTAYMDVSSDIGFDSYQWRIDTNPIYPDGSVFVHPDGDSSKLHIEGQRLSLGLHEVVLIVQSGSQYYSARFYVEVHQ